MKTFIYQQIYVQIIDINRWQRGKGWSVSAEDVKTMDNVRNSWTSVVIVVNSISRRRRCSNSSRFRCRRVDDYTGVLDDEDPRTGLFGDDCCYVGAWWSFLETLEVGMETSPAGHGTEGSRSTPCACHGPAQEADTVTSHHARPRSSTSDARQITSTERHGCQVFNYSNCFFINVVGRDLLSGVNNDEHQRPIVNYRQFLAIS